MGKGGEVVLERERIIIPITFITMNFLIHYLMYPSVLMKIKEFFIVMSYLGGKSTRSQHIIDILNNPLFNNMDYIEPFIGYAHILRRITNKKSYTMSDNNLNLFNLLSHIKVSGEYPIISKDEYYILKKSSDPALATRKAFASFAYSFSGIEWGGYIHLDRKTGFDYPSARKRYYDKLRLNEPFMNATLNHCDYQEYMGISDALIYCDPPYNKTKDYHKNKFNSELFWENMRTLSKNNWVIISEYNAPDDFVVISSNEKRCTIGKINQIRIEKVFIHQTRLGDYLNKA